MTDLRTEQLREVLEDYRERYSELGRTQERLKAVSCTATAPRQVVSATVGFGGAVTDVSFPSGAYRRMAPAELAATVLATLQEAHRLAAAAAAEVMAPTMPPGLDAAGLLDGTVDLRTALPQDPDAPAGGSPLRDLVAPSGRRG